MLTQHPKYSTMELRDYHSTIKARKDRFFFNYPREPCDVSELFAKKWLKCFFILSFLFLSTFPDVSSVCLSCSALHTDVDPDCKRDSRAVCREPHPGSVIKEGPHAVVRELEPKPVFVGVVDPLGDEGHCDTLERHWVPRCV